MCGNSFKKLFTKNTTSSDIPVIIEGVQRLNLAFSQVAFMSCAVAFFQTIDAACKTPIVLSPFSLMILLIAIVRISCLRLITTHYEPGTGQLAQFVSTLQGNDSEEKAKYPILHRVALRISGRGLLGYSFLQRTTMRDPDGDQDAEYEFSEFEENNIRMFIDALRFAWMAYSIETGAYFLQGVVALYLRDAKLGISVGLNTFECLIMVGLLFKAASALDRIIGTKGKDITNLMRGFGPGGGMTQVFVQMKGLFRSLVIAKVMTLVV